MKIGVLTGGGDAPGTNAVIRAIVRKGLKQYGDLIIGIKDGWRGLLEAEFTLLDQESITAILTRGGSILGFSRTNPFKSEDGVKRILENIEKSGIEAIIAIGGDDTLGVAYKLGNFGIKCLGVPKTIDNDLLANCGGVRRVWSHGRKGEWSQRRPLDCAMGCLSNTTTTRLGWRSRMVELAHAAQTYLSVGAGGALLRPAVLRAGRTSIPTAGPHQDGQRAGGCTAVATNPGSLATVGDVLGQNVLAKFAVRQLFDQLRPTGDKPA